MEQEPTARRAAPFEPLLAAALESMPQGVVITDTASTIVWANAAYAALTGYSLPELLGRTPALLRSTQTPRDTIRELWDGLQSCGRYEGRLVNRRADGGLFHAAVSLVRVAAPDGRDYFLCTMRDVSPEAVLDERRLLLAKEAEDTRGTTSFSAASLAEQRVIEAIREAAGSKLGGEVVVRSGDEVGRIYVYGGGIAWAAVTRCKDVLTGKLQEEGIDAEALAAVIAECKASGKNVGETLVAWGLMPAERFRELLREHVAQRLKVILGLLEPAVLFVPQARVYSLALTFTLAELIPEPAR